MKLHQKLLVLVGVLISLVSLYLAFKGISLPQVFNALKEADIRWILAALVVYTVGFLLRTWRWRILLMPIQTFSVGKLCPILMIGFFANNVLPLRMGEFLRAHVTGIRLKISRMASFGTILLERLFDTISFLATFCVATLFFPFPARVEHAAIVIGMGCLGLTAALFIGIHFHSILDSLLMRFPVRDAWNNKIRHYVAKFLHGISSMKDVKSALVALGFSLVIWTLEGTFLYLMIQAFPVTFHYPEAFFLLFFLGLSVMLPQGPGFVGTYELFGITALGYLGIAKEQALPIILSIHGCQFLFICIAGFWALSKEKLTLGALWKVSSHADS